MSQRQTGLTSKFFGCYSLHHLTCIGSYGTKPSSFSLKTVLGKRSAEMKDVMCSALNDGVKDGGVETAWSGKPQQDCVEWEVTTDNVSAEKPEDRHQPGQR